ncbi:hypothetical protein BDW67DRAFT_193044 [Aspergillus spinulosporus]
MYQRPAAGKVSPPARNFRDITFLPVNQPHSPGGDRPRRGYQSCDSCREKKKRCEPGIAESTCLRCQQESRVFVTTHRRKRRKLRLPVGSIGSAKSDVASPSNTPPEDGHAPIYGGPYTAAHNAVTPRVAAADDGLHWSSTTRERILSTNILDARDALDLVAISGSKEGVGKDGLTAVASCQSPQAILQPSAYAESTSVFSASWERFFLVKRGIIQAHEVVEYLDFYFSQLWHLFPIIPQWYSSPDHYVILAVEEPVLTISLVTIASRYHALRGFNGQARSERVHWRTWPWVQRLFQSALWGASAMRSHGAIAALLLFIEWHPRAINSPEDLISDFGDLELFDPQPDAPENDPQHITELVDSYRRSDPPSIPERLNIVAPAYRSNKMSWMLLSTAISLAQEIGCFNDEQGLVHDSATASTEKALAQLKWARLLGTFVLLTDEALALRLRLEPQFAGSCSVEVDRLYRLSPSYVTDGFFESTIDLALHMRKARELLQSWRKSQQGTGPAVSITAWDSFIRGLDAWKRKHLPNRTDLSFHEACLQIEYCYIRLCGLSPAAHMFSSSLKINASNSNSYLESLSRFTEEATNASTNILALTIHIVSLSKPLKYAAVRYWLYIFCASLYLLKVTLEKDSHLDSANPSINLIKQVVDAIKLNSPDDVHMSQRYAALLDILIKAALRTPQTSTTIAMTATRSNGLDHSKSRYRPFPTASTPFPNNELDLAEDWIYDSSFWATLPDLAGLDTVPSLIIPPFG